MEQLIKMWSDLKPLLVDVKNTFKKEDNISETIYLILDNVESDLVNGINCNSRYEGFKDLLVDSNYINKIRPRYDNSDMNKLSELSTALSSFIIFVNREIKTTANDYIKEKDIGTAKDRLPNGDTLNQKTVYSVSSNKKERLY